jgi:SAM-dependent methyltransferase
MTDHSQVVVDRNAAVSTSAHRPSLMARLYPERRVASFSRSEGRFLFYSMIADLLCENSVLLDLGAGRGAQIENAGGHMRRLINFAGRCERYIGVDPDPIVLRNPFLDEAHVMSPDGSIPLADSSVDIVVAYAVLEHVSDPQRTAREVQRVLKPGGWFCAWTPNRYGYVGMAARLVPNRFHAKIVNAAEPTGGRGECDVFPVCYRMNTKASIRAAFDPRDFEDFSFYYNGTPSYHFNRMLIAKFWMMVMAVLPMAMAKSLFVVIRKRHESGAATA